MAKGGHGMLCFCGKCTGLTKNKKKTGSKPVVLGGSSSYPTRDLGGRPSKKVNVHGDGKPNQNRNNGRR